MFNLHKINIPWRALFYLFLGIASATIYLRITPMDLLESWHIDMISGTAPAPNQYRPLTPWLAELLRLIIPEHNLVLTYFTLRAIVIGITLNVFDRYMQTWFPPPIATSGTMMLAAILPFTYLAVIQESDPINLLVFTLAFWAIARKQYKYLIFLMIIGTLNRETTAMIPAVYFVANIGIEKNRIVFLRSTVLFLVWLVVYGGLRIFYGYHAYYYDVITWKENVASFSPSLKVFLLFGVAWIFSFLGYKKSPLIFQRTMFLLPFYLALHYVIALVGETRLFLPWAPVVIPMAYFHLYPNFFKTQEDYGL